MIPTSTIHPSRGVSLVSFLLAVTILSFVLIPFYLALQTSRTGTVRSLNALDASNVAASVLERYRSIPFRILENQLLGLDPETPPESTRIISGPFQTHPIHPNVREEEVHRSGPIIFDADIYLSYFPEPNPNPDSPDFALGRQRILIRVVVRWQDRLPDGGFRPQEFSLSTVVHNESFSSNPSLRRLTSRGTEG